MGITNSKEDSAKQYAMMIRSASRSLLSIINDILDFSKIESGRLEIIEDTYQTASMLNDVVAMMGVRLQDKPVELRLEIDESIPSELYGDEVRLKQVMINLLGNSVKFTHEGYILLRMGWEKADEQQCVLRIDVEDTGIGIREEDMETIFSSFTQVDTKKNRSVEGTGLGLAISKRLVELMGGQLGVRSTYGKGTTFSFHVLTEVRDGTPVGNIEERMKNIRMDAYQITFSAKGAKVLVVDDNEMNLEVAAGILAPYDIEVFRAGSGAEAMVSFSQNRYDIIFMDHMMPVMDGVETMKKLRQMSGGESAIIIALTANALSGAAAEYKALGFQDFLAKPIEPQDMDRILRNYLPKKLIRPLTKEEIAERSGKESEGKQAIVGMQELSEAQDVIHVETGLKYCMGNHRFYQKMLKTFVSSVKYDQLETLYLAENWAEYQVVVHAVKGTALTIGAEKLSRDAKALEYAIRENRLTYVKENHALFLKEYRSVVSVIESGKLEFN